MQNRTLVKPLHVRSPQNVSSRGRTLVQLPDLPVGPEDEHLRNRRGRGVLKRLMFRCFSSRFEPTRGVRKL